MAVASSRGGVVVDKEGVEALHAMRLRLPDYGGLAMGPVAHLHGERERLSKLRWRHFDATLQASTIGAEIRGLDLRSELAEAVVDELRAALHDYKVIFFRDQRLSAAQHVAFARRFGELELHPFIPPNTDEPELVRFAKSADVGGYENLWHHDVTWRECPSMGAVLRAIEVPETGGDTLFADMYAAYEGLEGEWKERIDDMVAVHDYAFAFGANVPASRADEVRTRYPPVEHPVAPTHAATGRRYLYVNRIFTTHIAGMTRDQSLPILEHLCRQAEYPEYQCRFRWQPDSLAFWDNRAVQHYAASDYWPDVRVMERASIIGERPQK